MGRVNRLPIGAGVGERPLEHGVPATRPVRRLVCGRVRPMCAQRGAACPLMPRRGRIWRCPSSPEVPPAWGCLPLAEADEDRRPYPRHLCPVLTNVLRSFLDPFRPQSPAWRIQSTVRQVGVTARHCVWSAASRVALLTTVRLGISTINMLASSRRRDGRCSSRGSAEERRTRRRNISADTRSSRLPAVEVALVDQRRGRGREPVVPPRGGGAKFRPRKNQGASKVDRPGAMQRATRTVPR